MSHLSRPVRVVAPDTPCADVDEAFRTDPGLSCLAVSPRLTAGDQRWGLVSRGPFLTAMAGRLGYGRAVYGRQPVSVLADWEALVISPRVTLGQAAQRILERDRAARYSEVLVLDDDNGTSCLEVEDVLRCLAAELAHKALTDPLTGLANREHFLRQLDVTRGPLALVYVDVDDFKAINDGFGHSTGDKVLQTVAERLRGAVRPGDLAARLGGDEFALLLRPPVEESDLVSWARGMGQRLLACLTEPVHLGGRVLPGQASVGVAVTAQTPGDPGALLHEADLAMYGAKAAGGSRCAVVDGSASPCTITAHAPDRTELHAALAQGRFVLNFQPICEVLTGQVTSTEALVRWEHPLRGLLAPGAFLSDVVAAGFAAELDAHVLRAALTQQARWRAEFGEGAPRAVNVNLSVPGLLRDDLAHVVLAALDAAGVPPQVLHLELPEIATSAQLNAAASSLAALREAGVAIALDDVGSGAAGLAHLRDLRLDGVKIDRRYVAGMLTDERDAAVVRMLVAMAHGLGAAVTAEGVETSAHLQALRELAEERPGHLVHAQGFALGRPVPAAELNEQWRAAAGAVTPR
ncbi:putative bifunctional diguanylate cyclase/phosphodiesterase [Quadrisphaera granulorum]|uniref:putative bifunctional diguanylate cyclase/phosphodiesterase n=1 Tax=Quadrisphaera granulorum TaxID=317664 RepID=UPI0011B4AE18|nr:EAL domain-containing protein [Quadrisphaera granulorum]